MARKRLLLLSNSSTAGLSYLEHALDEMAAFLGDDPTTVLFVPYAAVRFGYDAYADRVRNVLTDIGHGLRSIHDAADPIAAVLEADAIAVGGGNTFQLVHELWDQGLIEPLRERVAAGVPFVGWSAGSNIACPTLRTTNDMPIVEPAAFETLGAVPFQINPHYLDAHPDGHMGETREERLQEFVVLNPDVWVVGLREGSALRVEGETVRLHGDRPARLFRSGEDAREVEPWESLDFLLG